MSTKLLSRDTDYAVRALCYLSRHPRKVVTADELGEILAMPRPFLRRILQRLNKHHILTSRKGKGGGFRLAVPPEQIRLMDLITIFQGSLSLNECLLRKEVCPNRQTCLLRRKIVKIEAMVAAELNPVTIASLLPRKEEAIFKKGPV